MIKILEAQKIIERETKVLKSEAVRLEHLTGRVLAAEIRADMDLPPFDRSQMDGFALKTEDVKNAPVKLKIIGESIAGKGFDGNLTSGEAVRIMTGAPVPFGANAVQKVELTKENEEFIEILEPAKIGHNINPRGSEVEKGKLIFRKGEIVTEQMIAAVASFGYPTVEVYKKPRIAILSTGSEIVGIGETPGKDQIRNSNSIMLKVFADRYAAAKILPSVKDDIKNLKKTFQKAVENFDVLITTGGVSVGDYDFTKLVLREIGAEIFFEKISLKPGKPTVFAKKNNCLIFGLPGNPVSAAVTFQLFARPALMLMQDAAKSNLKKGFALCVEKIKAAKERDSVLPVSLSTDKKGRLIIESLRFNGSSNFIAFARADALAFVPQNKNLDTGDVAEIFYL